MDFTQNEIENVEIVETVTGVGVYGMGFWTMVCTGFAHVFGTKIAHRENKVRRAMICARREMEGKAKDCDGIMSIRYAISGTTVLATGIAYKTKKEEVKPEPVEEKPVEQPKVEPIPELAEGAEVVFTSDLKLSNSVIKEGTKAKVISANEKYAYLSLELEGKEYFINFIPRSILKINE